MRFKFTHNVHFGYMREKGVVYDDLTEADVRNLGAPRDGFPSGYGHVVDDPVPQTAAALTPALLSAAAPPAPEPSVSPQTEEATTDAIPAPSENEPASPPDDGTRPDGPSERQPTAGPFHCPDPNCKFAVGGKSFETEAALSAHRASKRH